MTYTTDPIADFLIRIKNAGAVKKESVEIPYSKFKHAIAEVLKKRGFIEDVEKEGRGTKKVLVIKLAYTELGNPKIAEVKRVSKPGRRMYRKAKEIFPVRYGKGMAVYSTPEGVLDELDARKKGVGGEILFEIY